MRWCFLGGSGAGDCDRRHPADYPLAQACFIIISTTVMLMNLVADLLYAALAPRISYKALKG